MRAEIILKDRTVEVVMDEPDISVVPETVGPVINVLTGVGPQGTRGRDGAPGPKGDPGDDYILTEQDKDDIAELAAEKVVIPDVPVQDVQVGGVSVLSDGVANVPVATAETPGVLIPDSTCFSIFPGGLFRCTGASDDNIKNGNSSFRFIPTKSQHKSVFYGLATAAGDKTQRKSANPVGTYTDEAKSAIRSMLDVPATEDIPEAPVQDVQVNGVSIVQDGVASVPKTGQGQLGVVQLNSLYGIAAFGNGFIGINKADANMVKAGTENNRPIVPSNSNAATFYCLAKAAGHDEANSTEVFGTYSPEAQTAILSMLGAAPAEKLIYKDDTFGNIWTYYQPIGADFENNAIILEDATGIPSEITPYETAFMVYKWDEGQINFQYGTMPTELYVVHQIKSIGDNKIQFFKDGSTLQTITDSGCLDFSKCRLIYRKRSTPQPQKPSCDLPDGHKIHARFVTVGMAANASGVVACDSLGQVIRSTGYENSTARRRGSYVGATLSNALTCYDYDSYACIIGSRGLDYRFKGGT